MKSSPAHVSQHQQGNVTLMALICFLMISVCVVLALDAGRLYLERRNLQRVADLVALDIAASMDLYNNADISAAALQSAAWDAAIRNGLANSDENTMVVQRGTVVVNNNRNQFVQTASGNRNAVRVEIVRTVPGSIVPNMAAILPGVEVDPVVNILAQAVAQRPLYAAISAGTNLLTVSTDSSSLLGPLLREMLGSNVDINAVGYRGLLGTSISLLDLAASLGLSVINPQALLEAQVRAIDLVQAGITKLDNEGLNAEVAALGELLEGDARDILGRQYFALGDILSVNDELLTSNDTLEALVNLGDLLNAAIYAANKTVTVSVDNLGLPALAQADLSLELTVNQPPKVAVGPPGCVDGGSAPCSVNNWMTEARPAQLALDVPLSTRLLGGLLKLDLNLNVTSGEGRASLARIERVPGGTYRVDVDSVVVPVTVSVSTDLDLLSLEAVGLGSLVGVNINGGNNISTTLEQPGKLMNLDWPGPKSSGTVNGGVGSVLGVVGNALREDNLNVTIDLPEVKKIPILGGLLGFAVDIVVQPLVDSLLSILGGLGGSLTYLLDDILGPLLSPVLTALGLEINTMNINVLGVDAGSAELVV